MRQSRSPSCRASLSWVVQPRQPILLFHSGVNGLAPEPSGPLMLHKSQKKEKSSCATGQNGVTTCTYKLQLLHCPRMQGLREAGLLGLPGTACSRNWPVCAQVWSILRTDVFYCLAHAHVRELTGFMWSAIGSSGYYFVRLAILALGSTRRMKTGHQNTTGRLVYLCFISNPIRFVLPLHYVCHSPCSTPPKGRSKSSSALPA